MNNIMIKNLSTAIQINSNLKAALLDYLKEYVPQDEDDSELKRVLTGVLELHDEKTRDFLKYSDFQILSIMRQVYVYNVSLSQAEQSHKFINQSGFILQTMRGNNRAVTVLGIRYRQIINELEEIKTKLLGLHSMDLTDVRLENHKGDESFKLGMIEKKSVLESLKADYEAEIEKCKQVRADIIKWFKMEGPAELNQTIKEIDDFSMSEAEAVLSPYVRAISEYAGMNE